ncbi:SDR family oxidoreductase [Baekduia soli]|uniref:SDR family oxidoreductase n=1 Tax=Baekduia soli TaxID=496014 RepID=A0A5B8TZI0_9ACTN|nr:SDR family oxidoreductase [Baekduia soli]QEC46130.1 SDR family oxidoreductase [Baekduia soli]
MATTPPVSGPLHAPDLAGAAVLVAGAASGIGRAAALALAREGAHVLCFDLADAEPVAAAIRDGGGTALAVHGDLLDEDALASAVATCEGEIGPLRVAVNTAGIVSFQPLEEATADELRRILDVNLLGPMLFLKHALPPMRERGAGSAILFGSLAGKTGGLRSGPAYGASKGGVHALVKWTAGHYAPHGVRVNGVAPGPVATPMTEGRGYTTAGLPLARLGVPEDQAEAVVYLASDASAWVTGQILNINGGVFME